MSDTDDEAAVESAVDDVPGASLFFALPDFNPKLFEMTSTGAHSM
jgi:hypothetical protein